MPWQSARSRRMCSSAGVSAPPALEALGARYSRDTGGRVVVVDAKGRSVVDSAGIIRGNFSTRPEIRTALGGTVATGVRHSNTLGTDLLYVAVPVASSGVVHGAVRITYPMTEVNARIHRYRLILAAIAVVVLAVAVALGSGFVRWITRPLRRIEAAAGEVAGGDLAARAPLDGPPELQQLSERVQRHGRQARCAPPLPGRVRRRCVAPAPHAAHGAPPPSREPRSRGRHEERRAEAGHRRGGAAELPRRRASDARPGGSGDERADRARRRRRHLRAGRGLVGARFGADGAALRRRSKAGRSPPSRQGESSRCSTTCSRTRSRCTGGYERGGRCGPVGEVGRDRGPGSRSRG